MSGDDDEVSPDIQRLSVLEQLVGQGRSQPVGSGAGVALQQQHAVDDLAGGVPLGRAEGAVVQFQLRQGLAAGEFVVGDDEIALLVVEPVGECRCGDADEGSGNDSTNQHDESPSEKVCIRSSHPEKITYGVPGSAGFLLAARRVEVFGEK